MPRAHDSREGGGRTTQETKSRTRRTHIGYMRLITSGTGNLAANLHGCNGRKIAGKFVPDIFSRLCPYRRPAFSTLPPSMAVVCRERKTPGREEVERLRRQSRRVKLNRESWN